LNRLLLVLALAAASLASPALAQSVRTPYLQRPTERSITIAWRTAANAPSRVCYGSTPDALTSSAGSGASELRHGVDITGLSPNTRYFYRAGLASCAGATGDARDFFRTAPMRGSRAPMRMWIVGDSGTGSSRQRDVTNAAMTASSDRPVDLFLHLGDMAYTTGTEAQFDANFYAMYAEQMRNIPCWPTLGNHEGSSSDSATQTGPYYDGYYLPTDGSAGGLASGTEAYYAFDWGNVHFAVLDSYESSRATSGAMLRWLDDDLAAADADWLVVFFHHPPYTRGSHNSDTESDLRQMRENVTPILEAHGVDLVLAGHSHIFERSFLIRGATDTPTTAGAHIVDRGDGQLDGDGPYSSGAAGTEYVVAGHGGTGVSGAGGHPIMFFSEVQNGSCLLDVSGDEMTLRNIRYDGTESDHFTLVKRNGLFLAHPLEGERYPAGSAIAIAWSSVGITGDVRIESSVDGGATWSVVVDRTPDSGMYMWTSPLLATTRARIRITSVDMPALSDDSGDFTLSLEAPVVVIPFGSGWQYSDDGTDRGDAWRMGEGAAWSEGPAQLGYGDGDEATALMDADPNIPTVYFRQRFMVDGEVTSARLSAIFDDGIAVWINGRLVTQANIADFSFASLASRQSADNERIDRVLDLAVNPFVPGENWIAAQVKQVNATSSDLSFDLELELGIRRTPPPMLDAAVALDAGTSEDASAAMLDAAGATVDDAGDSPDAALAPPTEGGCGCRAGGRRGGALTVLGLALLLAARRRKR
jgi:hypothetical protein